MFDKSINSYNILAAIGPIGSGKDETCNKLVKTYGFTRIDFKTDLLETIWLMLNWRPENNKEYEQFKTTSFVNQDLGISITGRKIAEQLGTECIADYLGLTNLWIDKLIEKINQLKKIKVCIGDCRFEKEVKALLNFAKKNKLKIGFIVTNYKSERYDNSGNHESRLLPQMILKIGYNDQDIIGGEHMERLIGLLG